MNNIDQELEQLFSNVISARKNHATNCACWECQLITDTKSLIYKVIEACVPEKMGYEKDESDSEWWLGYGNDKAIDQTLANAKEMLGGDK